MLVVAIIAAATAGRSAGQSNPAATAPAPDSAQAPAAVASQTTPPSAAQASTPADPEYSTFFYTNDNLKLEGYLYKPAGAGPFPVVVYNHGSRAGSERRELPMVFIARVMIPAGYAVIVPERRGYGKSEGQTFSEEIGEDRGPRFVTRLQAEAGDVLGAVEYAKANLPVDKKRIVLMGFSFGGIVTTVAAGRSTDFVAVVNQAPGALNWNRSEGLREALIAAAQKIKAPMICMAAKNDATTENVTKICGEAKKHGDSTEVMIYPPFLDAPNLIPNAPGHALFGRYGIDLWKKDVLAFLGKHM
jgi:carboxymethylenebutenolidase